MSHHCGNMCMQPNGDCYNCPPPGGGSGGSGGGSGGSGGCFVEGTLITMSDGTQRKIEDLDQDEKVLSYNFETKEVEEDVILQIDTPYNDQLITIKGEHGNNTNTFDHPYWSVTKQKWVSYAPGETEENYELNDIWELEEGETLLYLNSNGEVIESKVESIEVEDLKNTKTYNLTHVKNNNNFFANGYLVHNKNEPNKPRVIPTNNKPTSVVNEDNRKLCPDGGPMVDGSCQGDYTLYGGDTGEIGGDLMDECPPCCDNPGTYTCSLSNWGFGQYTIIDNCNYNCVPPINSGECQTQGTSNCTCPGCGYWECMGCDDGDNNSNPPSWPDHPGHWSAIAPRNIWGQPKPTGRRGGIARRRYPTGGVIGPGDPQDPQFLHMMLSDATRIQGTPNEAAGLRRMRNRMVRHLNPLIDTPVETYRTGGRPTRNINRFRKAGSCTNHQQCQGQCQGCNPCLCEYGQCVCGSTPPGGGGGG